MDADNTETDAALLAMLDDGKGSRQDAATELDGDDLDADLDEEPSDVDELGDKGKQALDRMKARLKAERARRVAAEAKAAQATSTDEAEAQRREVEAAATAKANARIVRAEIKAAAAGKLADPADAIAFLDPSDFEVDENGDLDTDEIAEAIDDLIRRKPHLAAQGGTRRPKPDRSQGAQGTGALTTSQQFAAAISSAL